MQELVKYGALGPEEPIKPYANMLGRAFANYPVAVRAFAQSPGSPGDWFARINRQSIQNRRDIGDPVLIATHNGRPVGVAMISTNSHPTPPEIARTYDTLMAEAGDEAQAFFTEFLGIVGSLEPSRRHIWLTVLGVEPEFQGQGIGRQLIEETVKLARSIPDCEGVGLDTEDDKNVKIYESCGFRVYDQTMMGDMPIYMMWRDI